MTLGDRSKFYEGSELCQFSDTTKTYIFFPFSFLCVLPLVNNIYKFQMYNIIIQYLHIL